MSKMWQVSGIWNASLEKPEQRALTPRDYIWASELGGSYVDRFLRMKGVPPSNPISARSLRKFEAGNITEWIVQMVLRRAGILRETQKRCEYQLSPHHLKVTGKLDFICGGKVDLDAGYDVLEKLGLPDFFTKAASQTSETIMQNYAGKDLEDCILEVKSVSLLVFNNFVNKKIRPQHRLQTTHYGLTEGLPGKVLYLCKDDMRLAEYDLDFDTDGVELAAYKNDIELMTGFIKNNEQPPKEKPITFDYENFKFQKNWKFTYSPYLTMLYGFKNETEVEEAIGKKPASYNRVFNRIVTGKDMTAANKDVIAEFEQILPDWERQAELAQAAGIKIEETNG